MPKRRHTASKAKYIYWLKSREGQVDKTLADLFKVGDRIHVVRGAPIGSIYRGDIVGTIKYVGSKYIGFDDSNNDRFSVDPETEKVIVL